MLRRRMVIDGAAAARRGVDPRMGRIGPSPLIDSLSESMVARTWATPPPKSANTPVSSSGQRIHCQPQYGPVSAGISK